MTSSVQSPRLDAPLALGYIRRGHQEPGLRLEADTPDGRRRSKCCPSRRFSGRRSPKRERGRRRFRSLASGSAGLASRRTGTLPNAPRILFVTGKLAEPALRRVLADLAPQAGFEPDVAVLPITVAALMTTDWVARHLHVPPASTASSCPALPRRRWRRCRGRRTCRVERGPEGPARPARVLRQPPARRPRATARYDIEILAEINHAPRLPLDEILAAGPALPRRRGRRDRPRLRPGRTVGRRRRRGPGAARRGPPRLDRQLRPGRGRGGRRRRGPSWS